MNTNRSEQLKAFDRLLTIMDELREKCPWDKKQTMESLRYLTIEETYELSDAILKQDQKEIRKELGDLALHIVFYAKIASEKGDFDIADVLNSLCEKLIERHPHIYGNEVAANEEVVKQNWEKIKMKEKDGNKTILSGVPNSMPALVKAIRIQEKARSSGFDWEEKDAVWQKVLEEQQEFLVEKEKLEANPSAGQKDKAELEFGDYLFSLVNYARFLQLNPEDALEKTNRKFIRRFTFLETESKKDGKQLDQMSLAEMDEYWNRAKTLGL